MVPGTSPLDKIGDVLEAFRRGSIVAVFDSEKREGETDLTAASIHVTPKVVRTLRKDGGGLLCMTMPPAFHEKAGLPFLVDLFSGAHAKYPVLKALFPNDIPYDAKSSFTITINHRKTFTGITDNDRALTITSLARLIAVSDGMQQDDVVTAIGRDFRAPGHVSLLNTARGVLDERQGHTELTTGLMLMAGVTPSATICEMMGDDGRSLRVDDAKAYAERNGILFVRGRDILEAWKWWRKAGGVIDTKARSDGKEEGVGEV